MLLTCTPVACPSRTPEILDTGRFSIDAEFTVEIEVDNRHNIQTYRFNKLQNIQNTEVSALFQNYYPEIQRKIKDLYHNEEDILEFDLEYYQSNYHIQLIQALSHTVFLNGEK